MRKKTGFIIIVIIIAQICVPVGMIAFKTAGMNSTYEKGEKYKFSLSSVEYYDGHINFYVECPYVYGGNYASVDKDENGYAVFSMFVNKHPKENNYIKSAKSDNFVFPVKRIETEKFENIPDYIWFQSTENLSDMSYVDERELYYSEAYLEAYVYKGSVVADGIYVDGIEINEYLQMLNDKLLNNN